MNSTAASASGSPSSTQAASDKPEGAAPKATKTGQPTEHYDVVIVGAGVTGCAMAAALAGGARRILMLEARKGHKPRFAGELIHPTGAQVLDELGFLPTLRRHGGIDVDGFAVVKDEKSPITQLPYDEIPNTRPTGFAMEHRDLVEGMREVATALPGVQVRFGCKVDEILRDKSGRACGVRTSEGIINANLVLGCDGRHSKVRPLLGVEEKSRLVSFSVAMKLPKAAHLLPHPSFGHIFLGAWGPMLIYPIGGALGEDGLRDDARGVFDVTSDLSGGPKGATELLKREYAPYLPAPLAKALIESLDREPPQIAANEAIRTDKAVVPGAAIVGDAGGCSHPLTATGMTVGFTDAQRLGRLLKDAGRFENPHQVDTALRRYEIERYRFVRARELLADALYEVFRAAEPGTRAIREGIFRYWEGSTTARASSMALLSGAESRPFAFLKEYLTVVGNSTSAVFRGHTGPVRGQTATLRQRAESLYGLGKKGLEKMQMVVRDVRQEMTRRPAA